MQRDVRFYLSELLELSEYVRSRCATGSLQRYQEDIDYRFALERVLSMIGEVATKLRKEFPVESASIRDLKQIVGFRNILIHAYLGMDLTTVWSILEVNVPLLADDTQRLLDSLPNDA